MPAQPRDIRFGSIIRAQIDGQEGRNFKVRPLVVVDPAPCTTFDDKFVCVAISSTAEPAQGVVELPFSQGYCCSGLKVRSFAVCRWVVELDCHDVDELIGYVPPSTMEFIVRALAKVNAPLIARIQAESRRTRR